MHFLDEVSRVKLAAKLAHKADTSMKYNLYLAANDIAVAVADQLNQHKNCPKICIP